MSPKEFNNEFLCIDETVLDEEWIAQPKLFFRYAVKLADAKLHLEEVKSALDVCKAEVDKDIRSNPIKYGIDGKLTEAQVTSRILTTEEYSNIMAELAEAKHSVDIHQAMVNALNDKKSALENLVKLHGMNYFATPQGKKEDTDTIKDEVFKKKTKVKRRT